MIPAAARILCLFFTVQRLQDPTRQWRTLLRSAESMLWLSRTLAWRSLECHIVPALFPIRSHYLHTRHFASPTLDDDLNCVQFLTSSTVPKSHPSHLQQEQDHLDNDSPCLPSQSCSRYSPILLPLSLRLPTWLHLFLVPGTVAPIRSRTIVAKSLSWASMASAER